MATLLQPPLPTGIDADLLEKLAAQSSLQQIWLSGYLYGVALHGHPTQQGTSNGRAEVLPSPAAVVQQAFIDKPKVTLMYGSQTGNSKKVAGQIAARLREQSWDVAVADLNDYPTKQLKEEKILVLVISTQGEGEPPVAAEEFYKWLMGPRAPKLEALQFAVCGLGDSSYVQFCQTGKDFDHRFEALGAKRLLDRIDCDVDYETVVSDWTEKLLAKLPTPQSSVTTTVQTAAVNGVQERPLSIKTTPYDRKHPFHAPILEKIQLNGRGSSKETWHVELSLEGSGLAYAPGDSLGIYPQNPPALVRELLYTAMLNGNKTVLFDQKENTLRHFLLREVEITVLTRDVIEKYANWTNNNKLKSLLEDPVALKKFIWGRNVADLLREFPAALSEATLLSFLRKIPPRLYSIASSLQAHPEEVHLTVAAVRYEYGGKPHLGAASTFLADRVTVGESVPVFVEENEYFKLPASDDTDIIMVGPGTGMAPFRAFVEERNERGAAGKNWLFFGNPHFETDFLYQTEWLQHLKRGSLDRLDVAFSRDQPEKLYVQHRLLERSKLLFERLENGASFYVCGDKERMAADVQHAVIQVITKESGKDIDYATEYLKGLKKQRRYLEDVY
jgi:sulfite reductase (NADPH) flavoprotein alpha-component